jgi:hypothetical protein
LTISVTGRGHAGYAGRRSSRGGAAVTSSATAARGAGNGRTSSGGSARRPGGGGAGRPFPDAEAPDDADVIEAVLERIVAEAEERSRFCPWCLARLENGSAWCGDVCREDYTRKLMPTPFARSIDGLIIPSFARIVQRKKDIARSAAWREAHANRADGQS